MDDALTPGVASPEEITPKRPRWKAVFYSWTEAWQINVGWMLTTLSLMVHELPLQLLLKNQVQLDQKQLATFMLIGGIPTYIKPLCGILVDAVPFLGTRRRHYLLWGLVLGAIAWIMLALVPRAYMPMLVAFFIVNIFLTLNSTVLGGLMVEIGKAKHITGKLSAQRHGITRAVEAITGPLAGRLAKGEFIITMSFSAVLQLMFWPVVYRFMREERRTGINTDALREVKRQATVLVRSRTLWAAAGLIVLVVAAPGFKTPKLYYQQNVLGFDSVFIGDLEVIKSGAALAAAILYGMVCRHFNLRKLLAASIIVHALLTLCYLGYRDRLSAQIIEGIESATMVLALLPLYDLAARATPKGSEALGYSVMMSVWNFTQKGADTLGAYLVNDVGLTFFDLVWVNAGTTLLVLVAVPFLPGVLMNRRDGEVDTGPVH